MATQEVIDGLTQTIQDCLEAKLQAGFDANAALTIDIAREVASAVEDKANEYTDIEIDKVMTLITGGEVDLGPFTEFMNTIRTLLDGDEATEGYQVFITLVSDRAANKQLLISHATTIQSVQNTLTTFQSTLADHETRIAALEAAQHEPMDCEDCHDEILNLVKGSMAAACAGADSSVTGHYVNTHASILASFKAEMSAISIAMRNFYVLDGTSNSNLHVDAPVTLAGDFEVNMKFAVAAPYARSNFMLFGGDYDQDLYCRLDQTDRSIRIWMNSVDSSDYITFVPTETNPFDGNMHSLRVTRAGDQMEVWLGNEYLGSQDAYMYTGVNNLFVGSRIQDTDAVGAGFEGIVESFSVKDENGVILAGFDTAESNLALINMTPNFDATLTPFASIANGYDTKWVSTLSSHAFRYYVGESTGKMNIVVIGASILEQSFYALTDASSRFIKHGVIAEVYNRATSGDTSANLLTKMPGYIAEFAGQESNTLFVLHIGGNDISQQGPYPGGSSALETNYAAIINSLHAAGFQVAPTSITYRIAPASNPSEPYNESVVIPLIEDLTPEWMDGDVPVIDLNAFSNSIEGTGYEVDGIHPNGFGEASIREYIAEKVSGMLVAGSVATFSSKCVIGSGTTTPRHMLINFGEGNAMFGATNNIAVTGGATVGSLRNTDYSPVSDFGFSMSGFGNSFSDGRTYGVNELAIHNKTVSQSTMWVDQYNTGLVSFEAGSFDPEATYTIRYAASRDVLTPRYTEVTIGGVMQSMDATSDPRTFLEFSGVTGAQLLATGVTVNVQAGTEYAYLAGLEIIEEFDLGDVVYSAP